MGERFYLPGPWRSPELTLDGPEAHHLARVMRLPVGSCVLLFDGQGCEARATVIGLEKRDVQLRIIDQSTAALPTPVPITLAVAPPKGDRFRWLVEKATEIGVARLIPLLTKRTVVDPGDAKLDKLRQTMLAACKQSGRSHAMAIDSPTPFAAVLEQRSSQQSLLFDPSGNRAANFSDPPATGYLLFVGPEGGFDRQEVEAATAAQVAIARLGRTILRAETAAVAVAALVAFGGGRETDAI